MSYYRCYEFNNMDLFSCHDLDNPASLSPSFRKPQDPTNIHANTTEHDEDEFFYQQSQENLAGGYEISFENNFMKEHQTVFEK